MAGNVQNQFRENVLIAIYIFSRRQLYRDPMTRYNVVASNIVVVCKYWENFSECKQIVRSLLMDKGLDAQTQVAMSYADRPMPSIQAVITCENTAAMHRIVDIFLKVSQGVVIQKL